MACTLPVTLISESQDGDIGDDWRYELEVKNFSGGLTDDATISVPKHQLSPGATIEVQSLGIEVKPKS